VSRQRDRNGVATRRAAPLSPRSRRSAVRARRQRRREGQRRDADAARRDRPHDDRPGAKRRAGVRSAGAGNPVREFVFNKGLPNERRVSSPDIGRSAITGVTDVEDTTFSNFNAFKIPQLRGVRHTAPYFHDNSAKTLEDVLAHYTKFFEIVFSGTLQLTDQDRKDIVAFLKLLD
jgi:cytochrome c peroxidase